ncbi:MAG: carbon starvation protein A [Bacteroidaceae bacterium]|nr:carbon starvation protein A [Bacteroidaceae bacterium]
MTTFITSIILLILGYIFYGFFVERVFGADPRRKTPCFTMQDGVDYIPMPSWKVYLIQFLNIAGTGPIFGAIQGILFGPSAYLWIVFGCIFGGAVHDYLTGMLSMRNNGCSLPELVRAELGHTAHILILLFSLVLMILVGAVFVTTPATLLGTMTSNWGQWGTPLVWTIIIFVYYILATLLPIDKVIGRIYPLFGIALLVMAVGVLYGIFVMDGSLPEITDAFSNHHPNSALPLFPALFITIACGAISGFHATQSPMMARCMKNEKLGRPVFYGAMITEGLVALIWAAAAIKFADSLGVEGNTPYEKLLTAMTNPETGKMNPAIMVNQICNSWLGTVGAVLAILGVVAAPITSGDTAFRSARLITADFLHIPQRRIWQRVLLSAPLFAVAFVLVNINFDILWRYFGWVNQSLAMISLWTITVWLTRRGKAFLITLLPALFMTMVCVTYICIAPEGLQLPSMWGYAIGAIVTLVLLSIFIYRFTKRGKV